MNTKRIVPMALVAALGLALPALAQEDAKKLYESKCGMCHGKDGVAHPKMGAGSKNLNDPEWKKSTTVDDIVKLTKEGKGKMKGMADKLSDDQIKAIATYSLTLAK